MSTRSRAAPWSRDARWVAIEQALDAAGLLPCAEVLPICCGKVPHDFMCTSMARWTESSGDPVDDLANAKAAIERDARRR